MRPVLIGSAAARLNGLDLREPHDLDYFTDQHIPSRMDGKRVETFYHPDLDKWDWKWTVATLDELYTIKVSHMFWDFRWVKHAKDVIAFQQHRAVFIRELFDILYPIWVEQKGKKKARLPKGTKPDEFFTASVPRVYEHDSIHSSVAYYDAPLFNRVLQDNEPVAVSWSKFEALPEHIKMQLCREEVYATALERKVIPSGYKINSLHAYRWALQQTITSFWKGRWALWMVLHLDELQRPDVDYVQVHRDNSERLVRL